MTIPPVITRSGSGPLCATGWCASTGRGGRTGLRRYPGLVTNPAEFEARLAAVESRVEQIAADAAAAVSDAAAARHLAAARDRDLADLAVKVDANRAAINALGVQTAGRFNQVD